MPSLCMAKAVKTQRVVLIMQNACQAAILEQAVADHGLYFDEVRPDVFLIQPIPQHLRSKPL
jgi:hypothetical protein